MLTTQPSIHPTYRYWLHHTENKQPGFQKKRQTKQIRGKCSSLKVALKLKIFGSQNHSLAYLCSCLTLITLDPHLLVHSYSQDRFFKIGHERNKLSWCKGGLCKVRPPLNRMQWGCFNLLRRCKDDSLHRSVSRIPVVKQNPTTSEL